MMVDKNSWHYKVWKWTYDSSYGVPETTNFCSYMRRIMFLVPGLAIFKTIMYTLYTVCVLMPVAFLRWAFGYKTVSLDVGVPSQEYSGLQVGPKQVYPWHVLAPLAVVGAHVWAFSATSWFNVAIADATLLGIVGLIVGAVFLFTSDSTEIFREWFWTNKRKICPVIEFGDHYERQIADEDASE